MGKKYPRWKENIHRKYQKQNGEKADLVAGKRKFQKRGTERRARHGVKVRGSGSKGNLKALGVQGKSARVREEIKKALAGWKGKDK